MLADNVVSGDVVGGRKVRCVSVRPDRRFTFEFTDDSVPHVADRYDHVDVSRVIAYGVARDAVRGAFRGYGGMAQSLGQFPDRDQGVRVAMADMERDRREVEWTGALPPIELIEATSPGHEAIADAKELFDKDDVIEQTAGVECRKDLGIRDELPGAYKDLEQVITAQTDGAAPLIKVITHLNTVLCIKG